MIVDLTEYKWNKRQITLVGDNAARFYANLGTESGTGYTNGICQHIFDVQNTSNYKIRFKAEVANSNTFFDANTSHSQNLFTFIRLGDT